MTLLTVWPDSGPEETVLRDMESDLRTAHSAMDSMGILLGQVRRDCE